MSGTISFGIRTPPPGTEFSAVGFEFTLVSLLLLVLWVGVSTAVLFTPQQIRTARSVIAVERRRVAAERDAFAAFRRRLESLVPDSSSNGTGGFPTTDGGVIYQRQSDTRLDDVRDAYRETVMSVDHYEDDYAESLPDHLASELGEGVATAVTAGNDLTPRLQSALVSGVEQADSSRETLLRSLENEDDRLADAADELTTLAERRTTLEGEHLQTTDFDDAQENWQRLQTLDSRLDDLLRSQQERRANHVVVDADEESFYEYIYSELSTRYPVLVDGLALADRFEDLDARLTRGLASTR